MLILKNIRLHFSLCGILPLNGVNFDRSKRAHYLSLFVLLPMPVMSSCILLPYVLINLRDLRLSTSALYVFCGCANSVFQYVHLVLNRRRVQTIFYEIQRIADEREYYFPSNAWLIL